VTLLPSASARSRRRRRIERDLRSHRIGRGSSSSGLPGHLAASFGSRERTSSGGGSRRKGRVARRPPRGAPPPSITSGRFARPRREGGRTPRASNRSDPSRPGPVPGRCAVRTPAERHDVARRREQVVVRPRRARQDSGPRNARPRPIPDEEQQDRPPRPAGAPSTAPARPCARASTTSVRRCSGNPGTASRAASPLPRRGRLARRLAPAPRPPSRARGRGARPPARQHPLGAGLVRAGRRGIATRRAGSVGPAPPPRP